MYKLVHFSVDVWGSDRLTTLPGCSLHVAQDRFQSHVTLQRKRGFREWMDGSLFGLSIKKRPS